MAVTTPRSPLIVTLAVWKALFLREALTRLFHGRAAWFWLIAEPVLHVTYLMVIYSVVRVRSVGGIDTVVWIMVGMLAFFMFRRTDIQIMNALGANSALFTYRQVKPVDSALVRGCLEGLLMICVASVLFGGAAIFGHSTIPADPLAVFAAFFGLWLLGVGFGLITSVLIDLVPELGRVLKMVMMPLYPLSGVMMPIAAVPLPYRDWLMLNPVAHGLEAARLGFTPYYHAVPGLSLAYLYGFALCSIFLGLALHRRFALRLVTK